LSRKTWLKLDNKNISLKLCKRHHKCFKLTINVDGVDDPESLEREKELKKRLSHNSNFHKK